MVSYCVRYDDFTTTTNNTIQYTMSNPINVSGTDLEDRVESFLKENNIRYTRAKSGAPEIDFKIEVDGSFLYADCTNQNGAGSVEEKLPHKLWKYAKRYKYDSVTIIRGKHLPSKHVMDHCNDIARMKNFELHMLDYEQFIHTLKNKQSFNPLGI